MLPKKVLSVLYAIANFLFVYHISYRSISFANPSTTRRQKALFKGDEGTKNRSSAKPITLIERHTLGASGPHQGYS